jgi:hypothetical protein
MAPGEKRWWAYGVIAVVVPAIYFAYLLGQWASTAVTEIEFQRPLLTAAGVGVILAVVASIVLDIAAPEKAPLRDVRDDDINRLGERVGGSVCAVGMVVPFALAMVEADHFWIANSAYLTWVVSALAATTIKLVAYRQGV